jgi:hypothetical protein
MLATTDRSCSGQRAHPLAGEGLGEAHRVPGGLADMRVMPALACVVALGKPVRQLTRLSGVEVEDLTHLERSAVHPSGGRVSRSTP